MNCAVCVAASAVCNQCGAGPLLHSSPSQKQYVDPAW